MPQRRGRAGVALTWLALPLVGLAWLTYALRESAMAVIADIAVLGIGLAGLGLALALAGLRLVQGRGRVVTQGAGVAATAGALVALGLLVSFRFLPYTAEEVGFSNGGVVLAGTLFQPRGEGPYPGVVLIHGSGPESRDEYAFYARYLARRGVAALAYDKRGVGKSTGELYRADYSDYADDALAAVRLLLDRSDVDSTRVGLVGFSEAEWVAPLAASRSDRVAFLAVIGAAGIRPAEQVSAEIAIRLRRRGYADSIVERALALNEQVLAYQRTGDGGEALDEALRAAGSEPWFADAEDFPEEVYPAEEYAWWRSVMDFDPSPVWQRVRVPVLLLKGGRDDRSSPGPMREKIVGALRRGGNHRVEVRVYPDADHSLLEWPGGEGVPPPVFTEGYLETLVRWVEEQGAAPQPHEAELPS